MLSHRYSIRVGIQKPKRKVLGKKNTKPKGGNTLDPQDESQLYSWICSTPIVATQEKILLIAEGRINYTRDAYAQMMIEVWSSDDVGGIPMVYGNSILR